MLGERDEEDTARLRRHVLERLQPFSRERQFEMGEAGDISVRTRQACHDAKVDWIGHLHKYDRDGRCRLSRLDRRHRPFRHDEVRRFADELGCIGPDVLRIACAPDNVDPDIAVLRPTQLPQALAKRFDAGARIGGALAPHEQADFPHPLGLLRARPERPRGRAAEERDERTASHSITSSAVASSACGTLRPSILAVGTLMTSSNFVDCTTGKSAGFAPLRMRPAWTPTWRYASTRLAP